ncbi:hypothetical protein GCM10022383_06380 [Microbacterium soli]|uniref:Transcriptional regulator, AbiEi antitoxin, Type IV TA system n=1 Tax=Microbacterium soli TaxID=446075 RepID=A0ABP7MUS7_9MICO
MSEGALHRVRRGHFVAREDWDRLWPEGKHLIHLLAVVQDAEVPPVLSGVSAAVAHSLPLYRLSTDRVHVIVPNPRHAGSVRDLLRHEADLSAADIVEIDGLRLTSASRTVIDIARRGSRETAQSVADAALRAVSVHHQLLDEERAGIWFDGMQRRLARLVGARGVRQARAVVAFADGRAQLPGESVSRLRLQEMGFRRVELQVPVPSLYGSGWFVDFGLDDIQAYGEYDGEGKYIDPALRGGRDIEDVVLDEKRREDWIRGSTGRPVLRWGAAHIGSRRALATRLAAFNVPITGDFRLARR